jgi:hypothetical protein
MAFSITHMKQGRPSFIREHQQRSNQEAWHILIERGLIIASTCSNSIDRLCDTMVIFRIGKTNYAIPEQLVCSIQTISDYTPLPFTRPFIVGVVHSREQLLAVINLSDEPIGDHPNQNAILVVVQLEGMQVGLLTDCIIASPSLLQVDRI